MSTCECDFLELRYPIERNKRVLFNDDMNEETGIQNHDYYIDGEKIEKSVTGIIHDNFPHFDPETIANKIVNGNRWKKDPNYKYFQISKQDMMDQWKQAGNEASALGSIMHMDIEMFYNYVCFVKELYEFLSLQDQNKFIKDSVNIAWKKKIVDFVEEAENKQIKQKEMLDLIKYPTPQFKRLVKFHNFTKNSTVYPENILRCFKNKTPEFCQFKEFYDTTRKNIFPFRTELIMFDEEYKLAGSIDMLFKDIEGNILIYDWKRSKEFKIINQYQRGLGKLAHLDDCNITHYSLQLNMYRKILQTKYNECVKEMVLIRMHPDIEKADKFEVAIMEDDIDLILENHKEYLDSCTIIK